MEQEYVKQSKNDNENRRTERKKFADKIVSVVLTFNRNSHQRSICSKMFFKIGSLKKFANFTGKHLCQSLILIKLQAEGLQLN